MPDDIILYKEHFWDDPAFYASGVYALMHDQEPERAMIYYQMNRDYILRENLLLNAPVGKKEYAAAIDGKIVLRRLPSYEEHCDFKMQNPATLPFMYSNIGQEVPTTGIPYSQKFPTIAKLFPHFCREYGHRVSGSARKPGKITFIKIDY